MLIAVHLRASNFLNSNSPYLLFSHYPPWILISIQSKYASKSSLPK